MKFKPLSPEDIERIKSLHAMNYSKRRIAVQVNRDFKTVKKVLNPDWQEKPTSTPEGFFDVDEFAKSLTV